jgi:hypothetical protein
MPGQSGWKLMASQGEQTERVEALRGLIERLSAPDLTLTESKVLRDRLTELLGPAPLQTGRPPETSMRAAG